MALLLKEPAVTEEELWVAQDYKSNLIQDFVQYNIHERFFSSLISVTWNILFFTEQYVL